MKNFNELNRYMNPTEDMPKIVIVNSTDDVSIQTAIFAYEQKIAKSILVGNKEKINAMLKFQNYTEHPFEIVEAETEKEAAEKSVKLINNGKAEVIVKGHIQTGNLFKAILNKENGLRKSKILSAVTLLEVPTYHKVLGFTDGALMLNPTLNEKIIILNNALEVFHKLGYERPKVGVLEANEQVNPNIPSSLEAKEMMDLQGSDVIMSCIIDGPISFDLATNSKAAALKGYHSSVAGDVDILLGGNITVINAVVKSLQTFAGAKTAGIVMGAKCPIVLVSRASPVTEKIDSIKLALAVAHKGGDSANDN